MVFGGLHQRSPRPCICGLFYTPKAQVQQKLFLPQVELEARASILQTTSRVTLTQTFINPSASKGIREVKYVFPLYEGVSVVGFTCKVGNRTIVGEVKEKNEAKQDYTAAVARGETAGLFEQIATADTFLTTVGNVPPGAQVVVKIIYLGELKHDMEVDGIRFTIPNVIMPRYGSTAPGYEDAITHHAPSQQASRGGISITVDADMAEGSLIQKVLSPSHPISVSMGTTSITPNDEPKLSKASATLTIGSTHLENDFILQIVAKDTGVPKAILETHPTIPNQRALMATLVPRFALPAENPEIVFVCDRSGSMGGSNIELVKQALQVFLKSLPVGVKFNICSFGSHYSFLWPKSVSYSRETLEQAVAHVNTFDADYGGTEMLAPLRATIEQRYQDIPLEVMMLTDGEIWGQDVLFSYLNEQVQQKKAPIRVYSLGVGSGVSTSLVEGIARAGNGFCQTVAQGEKMDSKVVRMLKGALSPHVNDYRLEVKYDGSTGDTEDDDFEIVDEVADSLTVHLIDDKSEEPQLTKPISLFDPSVDPDETESPASGKTAQSRFAHIPPVPTPSIIQAPQNIPPLFAFNRTTVYLLLSPDAPHKTPKSVILRGTSTHGPLELEFPVQVLDTSGETIHQFAVKKATYELEQGRGWLVEAKDGSGKLLKEHYESRFSDMVEREAVRLGVQFQVSGKWCSFVAVEKDEKREEEKKDEEGECLEDEPVNQVDTSTGSSLFGSSAGGPVSFHEEFSGSFGSPSTSLGMRYRRVSPGTMDQLGPPSYPRASASGGLFGSSVQLQSVAQNSHIPPPISSGLFGSSAQLQSVANVSHAPPSISGGLFGSSVRTQNIAHASHAPPPTGGGLFGQSGARNIRGSTPSGHGGFGGLSRGLLGHAPPPPPASSPFSSAAPSAEPAPPSSRQRVAFSLPSWKPASPPPGPTLFGSAAAPFSSGPSQTPAPASNAIVDDEPPAPKTDDDTLALLIKLQTWEGFWEPSVSLFVALAVTEASAEDARTDLTVECGKVEWATAVVVSFLEEKLGGLRGSWELVVDKAKVWLEGRVGGVGVGEVLGRARALVKGGLE